MSSSLIRQVKNLFRIGPVRAFKEVVQLGDIKYGRLVGTDSYGNKYYENAEEDEIHLRTRWVIYKQYYPDPATLEESWHAWLAHGLKEAPTELAPENIVHRKYPVPKTKQFASGTPAAYVPYNTIKPKYASWNPVVKERSA
ncbi:hypothetical protein CANCADRAFT_84820 [Tortispora caseinolytica NRRL Y-17796]|uniref:NADH dehydrogenase [ubiquinone] 1 alpha subcomplex subunit n=1 Tax=Tortispora caseinolytica NRRL Y-17796 TaxID=767744 RepID=A0A1E4TKP7_9ASCO|nr:hypothetical protein CANCADRAFT_84820 [Tortispora caseinolytica NRRL Y-17796]